MKAEYVDHMGNDLTVVNSARVSFNKHKEEFGEGDAKLIKYLATHGHWTPFSHPQITLREKVPIFVARQRFKHMVGFTYNEVSRRYVDDTPEFFVPDMWRCRPDGSVKQGSGDSSVEELIWVNHGGYMCSVNTNDGYKAFIKNATQLYELMLENDVAPEQARMVLPQSMYTEYYVTGSLAAWARAYKQRIDPHSQKEIQQLADQWGSILAPLFPVSWEALTK